MAPDVGRSDHGQNATKGVVTGPFSIPNDDTPGSGRTTLLDTQTFSFLQETFGLILRNLSGELIVKETEDDGTERGDL